MEESETIGTGWLYQLDQPNETVIILAASGNEAKAIAAKIQRCSVKEVFGLKTIRPDTLVGRKTRVRFIRHKVSHLLPEYRSAGEDMTVQTNGDDGEAAAVRNTHSQSRPKRRKTRTVAK